MTDNERMDRAKRIREMREGARDDGDDETPSDETDNRTDGGDPEKQTMEDIVEASDEDTTTAADSSTEATATETSNDEDESGSQTPSNAASTEERPADDGTTAVAGNDDTGGETERETDAGDVTAPLPEMDELEEALEGSTATAEPETVSPSVADAGDGGATQATVGSETAGQAAARQESAEETAEEVTRVLEFTLDDEHYCLDIQYIEEIVKHENITRVPNTPDHVEGVVDLRGQITTILNPKVTIGKENDEAGELIVVFDAEAFEDQGYIGWVVDDVRQVSPIVESEVNDPPMAEDYINGVIDREDDDEFVIWTSPDLAFEDED